MKKKNNNSNFGTKKGSVKSFYKPQTKFQIGQQLSTEQTMMQEMFGNNRTFGTGENLPQVNGALISGFGLINNDDNGETANMFGYRKNAMQ